MQHFCGMDDRLVAGDNTQAICRGNSGSGGCAGEAGCAGAGVIGSRAIQADLYCICSR